MRKVIVSEWMTLDGVVQAPISPAEDRDGDFTNGGWHVPHTVDPVFQQAMVDTLSNANGFLFGRRTYEVLAGYWPNAPESEQAIAKPLNTRPKYIASRTLADPLGWQNAKLLKGNIANAIAALKREGSGNLVVLGSTTLVKTLFEHDLVDELRLVIDPVIVGGGKRIFREDGVARTLRLVESKPTSTGAIITTYAKKD